MMPAVGKSGPGTSSINSGIVISGPILADATANTIFWGVAIGLVVGKVLGIGTGILIAQRMRWGTLPSGVLSSHVWGVAALGGIGFTVSLFIAELSFEAEQLLEYAKIGIFTGSIVSALVGVFLLTRRSKTDRRSEPEQVADA